LSPRQAECMRRVRALQSTDQIARDLDISTGTINGYIREAVVALGARDRRHAALIFEEMERPSTERTAAKPDDGKPTIDEDRRPSELGDLHPSIVRDVSVGSFDHEPETHLQRVLREIVSGSRPEGWSMITRSVLVLAAVVVIGMAILFMSASLGIVYSLASAIRSATG
jgi:DNA-binding CsgD family transcriptional regulator